VAERLLGQVRDAAFASVGQNAIRTLARQVFQHLHGLSLRFHLERQTGGLNRAIDRGTKAIDFILRMALFNILPTVLMVAIFCAILVVEYDVWFAAITLACVVIYVAYTFLVTEWRLKYRRRMNRHDSAANTRAIDSLLNYETVKYFGNEAHETRRFDDSLARYEAAATKSQVSLAFLNIGQGVIIAGGLVGVMVLAAAGVAGGTMTVGDFVAVHAFLLQLAMPLNLLGMVYREVKQSLTDMEKMFELGRIEPEILDRSGAAAREVTGGAVEFDAVDFAYEPRRTVLKGVSFRLAPGRTLAIVGPSGSGKSTVTRLLFRFFDATGGAIRIDGQDIRDVTQASLRAAIGIVPQETVLFNDTLGYNLAYGRPGAGRDEIARVARLAHIDGLIADLPDGYDTLVGERGLKLSGGEKQRVAIARMLLKRPRILIFDEATSALDSKTEKEIQANLCEVSAGFTTIIVAHRLSTVVHADKILVLDAGRVIERGRHHELLALGGAYADMWRRQQEATAPARVAASD